MVKINSTTVDTVHFNASSPADLDPIYASGCNAWVIYQKELDRVNEIRDRLSKTPNGREVLARQKPDPAVQKKILDEAPIAVCIAEKTLWSWQHRFADEESTVGNDSRSDSNIANQKPRDGRSQSQNANEEDPIANLGVTALGRQLANVLDVFGLRNTRQPGDATAEPAENLVDTAVSPTAQPAEPVEQNIGSSAHILEAAGTMHNVPQPTFHAEDMGIQLTTYEQVVTNGNDQHARAETLSSTENFQDAPEVIETTPMSLVVDFEPVMLHIAEKHAYDEAAARQAEIMKQLRKAKKQRHQQNKKNARTVVLETPSKPPQADVAKTKKNIKKTKDKPALTSHELIAAQAMISLVVPDMETTPPTPLSVFAEQSLANVNTAPQATVPCAVDTAVNEMSLSPGDGDLETTNKSSATQAFIVAASREHSHRDALALSNTNTTAAERLAEIYPKYGPTHNKATCQVSSPSVKPSEQRSVGGMDDSGIALPCHSTAEFSVTEGVVQASQNADDGRTLQHSQTKFTEGSTESRYDDGHEAGQLCLDDILVQGQAMTAKIECGTPTSSAIANAEIDTPTEQGTSFTSMPNPRLSTAFSTQTIPIDERRREAVATARARVSRAARKRLTKSDAISEQKVPEIQAEPEPNDMTSHWSQSRTSLDHGMTALASVLHDFDGPTVQLPDTNALATDLGIEHDEAQDQAVSEAQGWQVQWRIPIPLKQLQAQGLRAESESDFDFDCRRRDLWNFLEDPEQPATQFFEPQSLFQLTPRKAKVAEKNRSTRNFEQSQTAKELSRTRHELAQRLEQVPAIDAELCDAMEVMRKDLPQDSDRRALEGIIEQNRA